ncbi:unnamed protein product, partial [Porites evermanni]
DYCDTKHEAHITTATTTAKENQRSNRIFTKCHSRSNSTVNRTTTNLQPLVPIGTQLQQPQFQVRMVQFPQQSGPAQIQQTIVQSPRPWKVYLFRQVSAVGFSLLQIQGKPLGTTVKVTQQTQGAQTTARAQGRSPAQRRKSQNK